MRMIQMLMMILLQQKSIYLQVIVLPCSLFWYGMFCFCDLAVLIAKAATKALSSYQWHSDWFWGLDIGHCHPSD